jgi:hypothetical protein
MLGLRHLMLLDLDAASRAEAQLHARTGSEDAWPLLPLVVG